MLYLVSPPNINVQLCMHLKLYNISTKLGFIHDIFYVQCKLHVKIRICTYDYSVQPFTFSLCHVSL